MLTKEIILTNFIPRDPLNHDKKFIIGQRCLAPISYCFGRTVQLVDPLSLKGSTQKIAPLALRILAAIALILILPVTLILIGIGLPTLKSSSALRTLNKLPAEETNKQPVEEPKPVKNQPVVYDLNNLDKVIPSLDAHCFDKYRFRVYSFTDNHEGYRMGTFLIPMPQILSQEEAGTILNDTFNANKVKRFEKFPGFHYVAEDIAIIDYTPNRGLKVMIKGEKFEDDRKCD